MMISAQFMVIFRVYEGAILGAQKICPYPADVESARSPRSCLMKMPEQLMLWVG